LRAALHYRPDIDGLRAIAVCLVIAYHYQLAPIPGGFIGVDVFFVISGYLITGILRREMMTGRFSPWQFYERRFRRIAPPLLVVVASTLAAGWFFLLPPDYESLGRQSAAALVGASNLFFWDTSGYFERSAAMQPLLHTWSLGVEEQFYLVWPLLFTAATRISTPERRQRILAVTISAVVVISFLASAVAVVSDPSAAFYLPMFRAWELALGAALVFLPRLKGDVTAQGGALLGLSLIGLASLTITELSPFPGPLALAPCLGAALVIWPKDTRTVVESILSARPVVWIGKLSYSLYLWHWPVLVLYRHEHLGAYPDKTAAALLVTLCASLSILTYVLIETPFRNSVQTPRKRLLSIGIPATAAVLVTSIVVLGADGFPQRLPTGITWEGEHLQSPQRTLCHQARLGTLPPTSGCLLGMVSAVPDTVLWGDSHGVELSGALADLYRRDGRALVQITLSSCPPALGYASSKRPFCAADNERILDYLQKDHTVKTVVLVSRHLYHRKQVGEQYADGFIATIRQLTSQGRKVVVLGPTPDYPESVPLVIARMQWHGGTQGGTIPFQEWERARADIAPLMRAISEIPGAIIVDPTAVFCDTAICRFVQNGKPMLFDDNHPSIYAAARIAALVYPQTSTRAAAP
jgi:peptidoglycan/LPS O-acetylase OafA/YrhL